MRNNLEFIPHKRTFENEIAMNGNQNSRNVNSLNSPKINSCQPDKGQGGNKMGYENSELMLEKENRNFDDKKILTGSRPRPDYNVPEQRNYRLDTHKTSKFETITDYYRKQIFDADPAKGSDSFEPEDFNSSFAVNQKPNPSSLIFISNGVVIKKKTIDREMSHGFLETKKLIGTSKNLVNITLNKKKEKTHSSDLFNNHKWAACASGKIKVKELRPV
jgi:hypothetical protein